MFSKLYTAVVEAILSQSNHQKWNNDTAEYAKVLSVSLQQRLKDITKAFDGTSSVIKALEMVRKDVDATHLGWHEEALLLGGKVGVIPSIPWRCGRQTNRDNTPAEDNIAYYWRTLTIPFLDQLIVEM